MDKEFENKIKKLKNIKLSDEEKSSMRIFLLDNLSTEEKKKQNVTNTGINRLYDYYQFLKNYNFMINKNKFVPTLAIVLIVTLTGGTVAFAEKSLPGDLLYEVKTLVTEPVAGIFALTKEEKTEWQERLVERRLEEAQKLISRGNLSEANRVNLENKIKNKIDEFNVNVNELSLLKNEDINSSDLNIRLQASLRAYENVLESLSKDLAIDTDTKKETEKLLISLTEYKKKVKDDHKNLELNVGLDLDDDEEEGSSVNSSALGKQNAATNILNSIKLIYQKEKIHLSSNIQNQINTKLGLAETALEEGKTFMISSDYNNAINKFKIVINTSNEARLLMLSNIIKGDIEDDMGIDNDDDEDFDDDIEIEDDEDEDFDDESFEDEDDDDDFSQLESIKLFSDKKKSNQLNLNIFDDEDDDQGED
jgi:hypothetical protein